MSSVHTTSAEGGPGPTPPAPESGSPQAEETGFPGTLPFGARLAAAMDDHGPLCVGIDPHAALLAAWGLPDDAAEPAGGARGGVRAGRARHDVGRHGARAPLPCARVLDARPLRVRGERQDEDAPAGAAGEIQGRGQ